MKNSVSVLIIASLMVAVFSVQTSVGQSCQKPSFAIKGKYEANCAQKMISFSSFQYCSLCPTKISEDKKSISFPSFIMDFGEGEMEITMNDVVTPVSFTTGKKFNYLKFEFNKKKYKFKLYHGDGNVDFILKAKTGNLITLKKVE
ncbi:MAG: hypothetical protein K9H64_07210 [Bacteroidales bacterium]|nr:hypothetical protein [Bacteroidales bacterium]MCF8455551.1 hypothetical protein [Bacteroidales bacterium]